MKPNGETLSTFLRHYASHYGNRETSVRRKPAEPHLKDGGIYRKRWWTNVYGRYHRAVQRYLLRFFPGMRLSSGRSSISLTNVSMKALRSVSSLFRRLALQLHQGGGVLPGVQVGGGMWLLTPRAGDLHLCAVAPAVGRLSAAGPGGRTGDEVRGLVAGLLASDGFA